MKRGSQKAIGLPITKDVTARNVLSAILLLALLCLACDRKAETKASPPGPEETRQDLVNRPTPLREEVDQVAEVQRSVLGPKR